MSGGTDFSGINEAKVDMEAIYNNPDPRSYYNTLEILDYSIPENAKPLFQKLISKLRGRHKSNEVCILDLGCSYGTNAALLKHDLSMDDLYDHWAHDELENASLNEVIQNDQRFFDEKNDLEHLKVIGIDQAERAVEFAEEVGLVDEGLSINLEQEKLPTKVHDELKRVDLMISTGCIGYVTEKSFEQLIPAVSQHRPAWIANFVLRMFPYDQIEETFNQWGYKTEKLTGHYFSQRKFASQKERSQVLEQLEDQEIDPNGLESEGTLIAEFYLSRPEAEARDLPLHQLLGV